MENFKRGIGHVMPAKACPVTVVKYFPFQFGSLSCWPFEAGLPLRQLSDLSALLDRGSSPGHRRREAVPEILNCEHPDSQVIAVTQSAVDSPVSYVLYTWELDALHVGATVRCFDDVMNSYVHQLLAWRLIGDDPQMFPTRKIDLSVRHSTRFDGNLIGMAPSAI